MSQRIESLLTDAGVPLRKQRRTLADLCGITPQAVAQWFTGDTKKISPEHLEKIARKYDADLHWLIAGKGSMRLQHQNVEPATFAAGRKVPLISEVRAGEWAEQCDQFAPGDAEDWIEAGANVGKRAFALRVEGDSMTSPTPPSIPHGAIVIVDPDIDAVNGSLVVAKLTDTQGTTFKKLVIDGPNKYLKPLNPDYKPIQVNGNCIIVGVVKSAVMQF